MPQFAAGTCYRKGWTIRPELAYEAVTHSLDAGINHYDTALVYRSQKPIGTTLGNAYANGSVTRDDLFLTTKVFHGFMEGVVMKGDTLPLSDITPDEVTVKLMEHVERCLHELNVGYVDMLLLHWPADFNKEEDDENNSESDEEKVAKNRARRIAAWKVLESALSYGYTRAIGVSNFSEIHLEQLMEDGASIRPMVNQIETSVFIRHEKIIEYCEEHGIVVQAYSPLGAPVHEDGTNQMLEHAELIRMGEKYGMNTGQIAMRYLVQRGFALTALSTSKNRLKSNLDIFKFVLDAEDMKILDDLNTKQTLLGVQSPYVLK